MFEPAPRQKLVLGGLSSLPPEDPQQYDFCLGCGRGFFCPQLWNPKRPFCNPKRPCWIPKQAVQTVKQPFWIPNEWFEFKNGLTWKYALNVLGGTTKTTEHPHLSSCLRQRPENLFFKNSENFADELPWEIESFLTKNFHVSASGKIFEKWQSKGDSWSQLEG